MIILTFVLYNNDCIILMSDVSYDMRTAGVMVSTAGTALKQFFSELREPVIPLRFYDDLKDAVSKFAAGCSK